ncbi:MAG: hypothetical protein NZ920_05260 [Aigarchaeota archaeon]|nr:hypothetical protein [Aigarchaeota archaeon]MDW8092896.1 hypothetical protein [Nitrososphaerota archaeon]
MSDEDIEIKRLRLKRMMEYLSRSVEREKTEQGEKKVDYVEELKKYLTDRGDEVLSEALKLRRDIVEEVAERLVRLIEAGRLKPSISGGELMRLFRSLRLNVRLDTTVSVLKGGESKSVKDLLEEFDK